MQLKVHDTLGAGVAKGYVDFYVGLSTASLGRYDGNCHLAVDRVTGRYLQACGEAIGHFHGGTRLRVACTPGTNTFDLLPSFWESGLPATRSSVVDDKLYKRLTVNIVEGKVTPVRSMVNIKSFTYQTGWKFTWDVAMGDPQDYYELSSMTHTYEDYLSFDEGIQVEKLFIEGKNMRDLQEMKLRVDRAKEGLDLKEAGDRSVFLNRIYQSGPGGDSPKGSMARMLIIRNTCCVFSFE